MYLLENDDVMKGKFRLVRIKNKLDTPANNIIINYMFMGKVQCELQLSTQDSKGKEKNNFTFSHFIYELTRGKFGPIAECASMISQLDPMIVACKHSYYQEIDKPFKPPSLEENNVEVKLGSFICKSCKKLKTKKLPSEDLVIV